MRVYKVLREELLADDLIAGQPSFSAEYMGKVTAMAHAHGDAGDSVSLHCQDTSSLRCSCRADA